MIPKTIPKKQIFTAILASFTLLTLTAKGALSDEHIGVRRQPLSIGYSLQNDSTRTTVNVNVSKDFNRWQTISIPPQSTREFRCNEYKYVRIITRDSGTVQYRIDCDRGRRYSVAWNRNKRLWDVYRLLN